MTTSHNNLAAISIHKHHSNFLKKCEITDCHSQVLGGATFMKTSNRKVSCPLIPWSFHSLFAKGFAQFKSGSIIKLGTQWEKMNHSAKNRWQSRHSALKQPDQSLSSPSVSDNEQDLIWLKLSASSTFRGNQVIVWDRKHPHRRFK